MTKSCFVADMRVLFKASPQFTTVVLWTCFWIFDC